MRARYLIPITSVVLLAMCAASPSFAQVAESMTVEVVEVPVYVTSADGTPLRGLQRGRAGEKREVDALRIADDAVGGDGGAQ